MREGGEQRGVGVILVSFDGVEVVRHESWAWLRVKPASLERQIFFVAKKDTTRLRSKAHRLRKHLAPRGGATPQNWASCRDNLLQP